jgi:hypothetical protein
LDFEKHYAEYISNQIDEYYQPEETLDRDTTKFSLQKV